MKKTACLLLCLFLSYKALPQLAPSTIGQVYNLAAGDSFEYEYSSYTDQCGFGDGCFSGYSLMIIDSVVRNIDSFYYYGYMYIYIEASQIGPYGYLLPFPQSYTPGKIGSCVGCLFSVLAPDSLIFSMAPVYIDAPPNYPYRCSDTAFTNTYYNSRKQNEANCPDFEEGTNDTYADGIGLVSQSGYSNTTRDNQQLLYYHKSNGEKWGTYYAANFTVPLGLPVGEVPIVSAKLIPNPVSDKFQLLLSTIPAKEIYLDIYDVTGRQVMHKEVTTLSSTFNRGNLPAGAFLWQLTSNTQVLNRGILVFQ